MVNILAYWNERIKIQLLSILCNKIKTNFMIISNVLITLLKIIIKFQEFQFLTNLYFKKKLDIEWDF